MIYEYFFLLKRKQNYGFAYSLCFKVHRSTYRKRSHVQLRNEFTRTVTFFFRAFEFISRPFAIIKMSGLSRRIYSFRSSCTESRYKCTKKWHTIMQPEVLLAILGHSLAGGRKKLSSLIKHTYARKQAVAKYISKIMHSKVKVRMSTSRISLISKWTELKSKSGFNFKLRISLVLNLCLIYSSYFIRVSY